MVETAEPEGIRTIVANWREVPPNVPVGVWWERIAEVEMMLECERLTAKVFVWEEITGAAPEDISCWWEVRMGRRDGLIAHSDEVMACTVDEEQVKRCGFCGARWSYPWDDRCGLCDRVFGEVSVWTADVKPVGGSGAVRTQTDATATTVASSRSLTPDLPSPRL